MHGHETDCAALQREKGVSEGQFRGGSRISERGEGGGGGKVIYVQGRGRTRLPPARGV